VTSTLLTLVIVPAVFTVFDDLERWLAPKAGRLLAEPIGSTAGRLPLNPAGRLSLTPDK
jgi:hypothetical protein